MNNKNDDKITLKPNKGSKVVLNGNEITGEKELHHNDRFSNNEILSTAVQFIIMIC